MSSVYLFVCLFHCSIECRPRICMVCVCVWVCLFVCLWGQYVHIEHIHTVLHRQSHVSRHSFSRARFRRFDIAPTFPADIELCCSSFSFSFIRNWLRHWRQSRRPLPTFLIGVHPLSCLRFAVGLDQHLGWLWLTPGGLTSESCLLLHIQWNSLGAPRS